MKDIVEPFLVERQIKDFENEVLLRNAQKYKLIQESLEVNEMVIG